MIFKPPRRIAGTDRARPVILAMKTLTPFLLVAFAPLAQPARAFDHLVLRLAGHRTLASGEPTNSGASWNSETASSILETVTGCRLGETGLEPGHIRFTRS
jgi:hypothetical protein